MWGNRQGWIYSVIIAAMMIWFMWDLAGVPPPPTPSGQFPQLWKPIELPVSPDSIHPANDVCDAGDNYRKAIDHYLRDPKLYDRFYNPLPERPPSGKAQPAPDRIQAIDKRLSGLSNLEAIELIVKAASCRDVRLFVRNPEEIVNYNPTEPALDAVRRLGDITNQVASLYQAKGDATFAAHYYDAAFALGSKLYKERLVHAELSIGLGLMADAAQGMKIAALRAKDEAKIGELDEFISRNQEYYQSQVLPLWRTVNNATSDNEALARSAGDVLAMAKTPSADRMWRTESLLRLGLYRFNAARKGDQVAAAQEVLLWTADPDASIRAASTAASQLTVEQYRLIH